MVDAYFNGEKGRWITTKTKKHVFIPEGKTPEEVLSEMFEEEEFDSPDNNNDIMISDQIINSSSGLTDSNKDFIRKINSQINPDALEILNDYHPKIVKASDKERNHFDERKVIIKLKEGAFKTIEPGTDYYATGQTYLHETGHFIDYEFDSVIGQKYYKSYASSSFISPTYGDTLHNIVSLEKSKMSRTEGVKLSVLLDEEFIEKFSDDPKIKEIRDFRKDILDEAIESVNMNTLVSDKFNVLKDNFIAGNTDNMEEFRNKIYSYLSRKCVEKFSKEDILKFNQIYPKSALYGRQKYSIVSDALSSRRDFTQYRLANFGHSASYYYKYKYDGLGTEFFANYFSAWSRNDKEQMEITRKYMPKSCEIFDEMIEAYKNKKGIK